MSLDWGYLDSVTTARLTGMSAHPRYALACIQEINVFKINDDDETLQ